MKLSYIITLPAAIVITAALACYFRKGNNLPVNQLRIDTVFVLYAVHDTLPCKIRLVKINTPVSIDSLWKEALSYAKKELEKSYASDSIPAAGLNNYRFISRADTAYSDSLISLRLQFNSPIPLHPSSYFSYDIIYKEKQIRHYFSASDKSFWKRFNYSVNCGFGYGLLSRNFDVYIGLGGSFNF